ncbi:MAG: RluA family pseudouridine synthase [Arcobacter sp.]|nr:MAG: RluA family pseudouridine synthase [Arcobacter sp.]
MNNKKFTAQEEIRLDMFLAQKLNETRNQIDQLISKGFVSVENKKKAKSGLKLKVGQNILVTLPEVIKEKPLEVDFDIEIIYEDKDFMVINKPSGVVVHGAPSVKVATLVDWLKKKNISLSTVSGEERHGIVHRIDKGTSGLLCIAKTNEAHVALSKQLENKTMGRFYLAMIDLPLKEDITIDAAISRNPSNRLKMGLLSSGKRAKTSFVKLSLSTNEKYELIAAKLFTGRTHQIRLHLESLHRHILGDSLYGFKGNVDKIKRVYLHAYSLYLQHPITNEKMNFTASLPEDMENFYKSNFNEEDYNEKINTEYIISRFNSTN